MPNYKWVPIGYHGRARRSAFAGPPFHTADGPDPATGRRRAGVRPLASGSTTSSSSASTSALATQLGEPIPIDEAEPHLFGLALLNDWSARDIQAWEYQPLGPFLSKNFAHHHYHRGS